MKKITALLIILVLSFSVATKQVKSAEIDSSAVQEENIKPLSGIGKIFRIDFETREMGVNDYLYTLNDQTQYLDDEGGETAQITFQSDTLVRFEANEKGEVLSLWLYSDPENEYNDNNNGSKTGEQARQTPDGSNKKKEVIINEDGVWKN